MKNLNLLLMSLVVSSIAHSQVADEHASSSTHLKFNLTSPIGRVIAEKTHGHEHVYVGYFCLSKKFNPQGKMICAKAQFGKGRDLSLGVDFLGNTSDYLGTWESFGPIFDVESGNSFYLKTLEDKSADDFKDIWKAVWNREGYNWSEHAVEIKKSKLDEFMNLVSNYTGGYRPPVLKGACEEGVFENRGEFRENELENVCTAKKTISLDSLLPYTQCVIEKSKFSSNQDALINACASLIPPPPAPTPTPPRWFDPLEKIYYGEHLKKETTRRGSIGIEYLASYSSEEVTLSNINVYIDTTPKHVQEYLISYDDLSPGDLCNFIGYESNSEKKLVEINLEKKYVWSIKKQAEVETTHIVSEVTCKKKPTFLAGGFAMDGGFFVFSDVRYSTELNGNLELFEADYTDEPEWGESARQFCKYLGLKAVPSKYSRECNGPEAAVKLDSNGHAEVVTALNSIEANEYSNSDNMVKCF